MIIVRETMRFPLLVAIALFVVAGTAPLEAGSHPPPSKDAASYPAVDIHKTEQVAIAAVPFNGKDKPDFFRVDYLKYGFMPIRVIVTNDSDRPISLNNARIDFISAAGDKIPAAEPEDIDRRTTSTGNPNERIPLPGPLPSLHGKPKSADKKIQQDFSEFEYNAITVEPHTTQAGFLFYDVQGLGNAPLRGAKLELREMQDADGKQLFSFEIPFDKFLEAK